VTLWDGVGPHPSCGVANVAPNLYPIALPPYSPESNPVEKLWDQVRDRLYDHSFESLPEVKQALVKIREDGYRY
jgi:transposase